MSHVLHLYDIIVLLKEHPKKFYSFSTFPEEPLCRREFDGTVFLAKNAQIMLCLKGCNVCLQEDRRLKVDSISP